MDRVLRSAIFSGIGLGVSGGALGFAFLLATVKMNWLGAPSEATFILAMTIGEILGMSAWLILMSRLARRRKQ